MTAAAASKSAPQCEWCVSAAEIVLPNASTRTMPQANQFCQKSVTFQLVAANLLPFSATQVDQETGADLDPQNLAASRWAMSRSRGRMCLGESKHYAVLLLSLHTKFR